MKTIPTFEWFPGLKQRQVGDIYIWWAPLHRSSYLVRKMETCLVPEERERALQLIRWRDRERFTVCRGLLRHLLSSLTGKKAESLRFQYGPNGKPKLRGHDLEFNMSHSHDWVIIAVSPFSPVGVDVERVRRNLAVDKLVDKVMSSSEKEEWRRLTEEARLLAFFRLWTRKEAVVKATGEGLISPLSDFTVGCHPMRYRHVDNTVGSWEVVSLDLIPEYEVALCVMV